MLGKVLYPSEWHQEQSATHENMVFGPTRFGVFRFCCRSRSCSFLACARASDIITHMRRCAAIIAHEILRALRFILSIQTESHRQHVACCTCGLWTAGMHNLRARPFPATGQAVWNITYLQRVRASVFPSTCAWRAIIASRTGHSHSMFWRLCHCTYLLPEHTQYRFECCTNTVTDMKDKSRCTIFVLVWA